MNTTHYLLDSVKTLTAKGRRNGLKILTLGVGLAVGLILASKVCFEQNFDDFYNSSDRICYVSETVTVDGEYQLYAQTSGGIARRMKEHYPEVDEATRFTWFESMASLIMTDTRNRIDAPVVMLADSDFFKVLDRKCLAGGLTEELDVPGNAVISSAMARKIAGSNAGSASEVIGKQFTIGSRGADIVMTVVGVYEEFPLNSSHRPDVLISLPTIGEFMWDGSDEILGNDRYNTVLKLKKGSDISSLNEHMEDFRNRYLPVEEMKEWGSDLSYVVRPYEDYHRNENDMGGRMLVLGLVAFALILTSVLNYILIVVSTSVTRSREMALRKCLGSEDSEMYKMMFSEAFLHTVLAAVLCLLIVLACGGFVESLTGTEVSALFRGKPLALALSILAAVTLVNGVVPAIMFNRIPVATAFRNYRANRRAWKLGLLAVEFGAASFLGVLICIISLQYSKMMKTDLGFNYENILELAIPESNGQEEYRVVEELRKLSFVEDAALGFNSLFEGLSGNMVTLPGESREIFNVRDGYYVDDHYLNTMGIKIREGGNFTPGMSNDREVIVDRRFAEVMKQNEGWDDVLGRQVRISGHAGPDGERPVTIVGVTENITTGSLNSENSNMDSRPLVFFYLDVSKVSGNNRYPFVYVRFDKLTEEKAAEVTRLVNSILPDQNIYPDAMSGKHRRLFADTMSTRDALLAGGTVAIIIAILGLVGYTVDEIKRRSKEIAVRRVNGAQFSSIRKMFIADIMKIAVPSVFAGGVLAALLARNWEQQFTIQVGLPLWIILAVVAGTLAVVALVSDLYVQKVANSNPAESLKSE